MLNNFWKALKRDITLKDIKKIETNLPSSIPYIGPIYAGILQDLAHEEQIKLIKELQNLTSQQIEIITKKFDLSHQLIEFIAQNIEKLSEYKKYVIMGSDLEKLNRIKYVYVKPKCYSKAKEILRNNKFLIITGCAHLGKTSMGYFLGDTLKDEVAGHFLVFPPTGNLFEINDIKDSIILFDDPFGGAEFQYRELADRIDDLRALSITNYIILTSRREIFSEVKEKTKLGETNLDDVILELKEDDYSDNDFELILRKHLDYYQINLEQIRGKLNKNFFEYKISEIIRELRFPHNYERLVGEEFKKVVEGKKNLDDAIRDAKEIEKAVGRWFSSYFNKDKEIFNFLFTLALFDDFDEETFIRVYKTILEQINGSKRPPNLYDLERLRKNTASYVSREGRIKLEHPSYRTGVFEKLGEEYRGEMVAIFPVLNILANDEDRRLREATAQSIKKFGILMPNLALQLLKTLIANGTISAGEGIGYVSYFSEGRDKDIHFLEDLLKDENKDIRIIGIYLCKEIGDIPNNVLTDLKELTKDKDWFVRKAIADLLGYVKNINNEVLIILRELSKDDEWFVRQVAASYLRQVEKNKC